MRLAFQFRFNPTNIWGTGVDRATFLRERPG